MTQVVTESLPESTLASLSELVATQIGLWFPPERWRDLDRGIRSAAREFGFKDAESCIEWLRSSRLTREQIEILASSLTVGETYFFREKKVFEVLEQQVLPELIRSRWANGRHLRVWSAGCASGEEPYSLAILLSKILPDIESWNASLLGTDIDPRRLQKARSGRYNEWSLRDVAPEIKENYFRKTPEGGCELLPEIRRRVAFGYLNLAEDVFPSLATNTNAMDVIFCRNVLMYFALARATEVVRNFHRALLPGGWLIVSPVEASCLLDSGFQSVSFSDSILYRKESETYPREVLFLERTDARTDAPPMGSPDLLPGDELDPPFGRQSLDALPSVAEVSEVPNPPQPSYAEALELYDQGRYEEAAKELRALLDREEGDGKAAALLARAYANQGKLSEALEWCGRAAATDKLNPACHYLQAVVLQELGSLEQARVSLRRALYLDQDFVLAHFALGNLALQQDLSAEARKHFENALAPLGQRDQDELLPEGEGLTAGRLREIIRSTVGRWP